MEERDGRIKDRDLLVPKGENLLQPGLGDLVLRVSLDERTSRVRVVGGVLSVVEVVVGLEQGGDEGEEGETKSGRPHGVHRSPGRQGGEFGGDVSQDSVLRSKADVNALVGLDRSLSDVRVEVVRSDGGDCGIKCDFCQSSSKRKHVVQAED